MKSSQLFAGSPFKSSLLSLHACRTGVQNMAEFRFSIDIDERAINSSHMCDLRWKGLPHCSFADGPCLYNASTDPQSSYSVRCPLNTEKENYINSFEITIDRVDDLPPCGSTGK